MSGMNVSITEDVQAVGAIDTEDYVESDDGYIVNISGSNTGNNK